MAKEKPQLEWRDRYVETVIVRADEIAAHPRNPKVHGEFQKEALTGLLADVGKVDSLKLYRNAEGKLICWDGHCRRDLKPDEVWRGDVYDLTEDEVLLLLASFDPIGWQATQSAVKLNDLLRDVSTGQAAVMEMLSKEAERCGAVADVPDFEPVGIEEQGRLDEKAKVECPECGCRFEPK